MKKDTAAPWCHCRDGISAVNTRHDFAAVMLGFFLLRGMQVPVTLLVAGFAAAGGVLQYPGQ